jgi:4,5-dihydroxyphthalate decarboxylase
MSEIGLTVACADYDRTRPILDGRVGVEGCRVIPVAISPEDSFPRAVSRAEFDVSELSVSSYLLQHSRGECPYIAIPAFLSRSFRHDCYYIRADSGIRQPKDLEGRLVGVPEYQMTLALWGRGILQDEYGVDFRKLRYRTGGTNKPGRKERLPLRLPGHMDVKPIPADRSLNDMLLAGEIDAIMSPGPPKAFVDGHPNVRRLIDDPPAAECAYYERTRIFPILHFVGIRRALVEQHPWLPERVFAAFVEAKKIAMREVGALAAAGANPITLPWFAAEVARTRALMGDDFWTYGIAANRRELEAMCRYSVEQYLSERPLTVDALFAESTLET